MFSGFCIANLKTIFAALDAVLKDEIVAGGSPRWNLTCRNAGQNCVNSMIATLTCTTVSTVESYVNRQSDARTVVFAAKNHFLSSTKYQQSLILPLYWEAIFASVGDLSIDHFYAQLVNRKIFDAVFEKTVELS